MRNIKNNNKAKYIILAIFLISLITSIIIPILNNKDVLYATEAEIEGIKYSYNTTKKELMITAKTANSQVKSTWQTNSELSKYVNSIENIVVNSTEEISIEENAFKDCISLKNITLTEKCTVSETAFEGCIALETLTVIKENNEKLQYTYTDGAWVEKNKTTQTVSSEEIEETAEEVEQEIETVEQNVKAADVSHEFKSGNKEFTIETSGIYKLELEGSAGQSVDKGGTHKADGGKGGKVTGYVRLKKGDVIKSKQYAAGEGKWCEFKFDDGSGNTFAGEADGYGGPGIGLELVAEPKNITLAGAGGGSGALFYRCRWEKETHGAVAGLSNPHKTKHAEGTTGQNGKEGNVWMTEKEGHSAYYVTVAGPGAGGGYPYGGVTITPTGEKKEDGDTTSEWGKNFAYAGQSSVNETLVFKDEELTKARRKYTIWGKWKRIWSNMGESYTYKRNTRL